jgi:uncharacterized membrane protein
VMVIMALDHVRDFFFKTDIGNAATVATDPTNMDSTTPALFFTRWITHFCAPIFVFLSGTSAFLIGQKKSKAQLSGFLISRGIWLVLVELVIITLGWTFDPLYHIFILQVIWAIGVSMIILGLIVYLPIPLIFLVGLVIVLGHNLTDYGFASELKGNMVAELSYFGVFKVYPISDNRFFIIVYSFLPWTGIMLLGYCFGVVYTRQFSEERRRRILVLTGSFLLLLFVILRATNWYGDPVPWSEQPRGTVYTFLSFLNLNKYPPSLLFICMTIGPALLLLSAIEKTQNGFTRIMNIYGRVPMFYYIIHFYIIHTLVVILFYATGHGSDDIVTPNNIFLFRPSDLGFGLPGVYLVWMLVVLMLYPLCKRYDRYKSTHTHWWLKYI